MQLHLFCIGNPDEACANVAAPDDLDFSKILRLCQTNEKVQPPLIDVEIDGCSVDGHRYLTRIKNLSTWIELNSQIISGLAKKYKITASNGVTLKLGDSYLGLPWAANLFSKGLWPIKTSGDKIVDNEFIYRVNSFNGRLEASKIPGCISSEDCNIANEVSGFRSKGGHYDHFHINVEK